MMKINTNKNNAKGVVAILAAVVMILWILDFYSPAVEKDINPTIVEAVLVNDSTPEPVIVSTFDMAAPVVTTTSVPVTTVTTTTTTTTVTTITTTTNEPKEFYAFYKESMRVHRSSCKYYDDTMERIDGDYIDYARPCEECHPDIEIGELYIPEPEPELNIYYTEEETYSYVYDYDSSSCLTASSGIYYGPSGLEKYYNLDMSGCISIMRSMGYSEEEYPYWVRDDGVKMFGDYVMCAADLDIRDKGTVLDTSLGTAIVVDTGSFASCGVTTDLDMCVAW